MGIIFSNPAHPNHMCAPRPNSADLVRYQITDYREVDRIDRNLRWELKGTRVARDLVKVVQYCESRGSQIVYVAVLVDLRKDQRSL